ncbi:DUF3732 domain-containing protein [Enterococcus sp. AZ192]|uniref:DUF3732 domain-containing protein n=1 Tax=unclassified Enterococcus TaxID=2608891 RepID=UPI003D264EF3
MRFCINNLFLWQKDGYLRKLDFLENKINVITGGSGTGKSEIISIIEYCFLSSDIDITEVKINENVNWYGINFDINEKNYTIARYRIENSENSDRYYFSSMGKIPSIDEIESNITEEALRQIVETEFGISEKTVFPFGGKKIKLGSKISFRYFFMFNIVSDDIIANKNQFFDTRNNSKYIEALERIFDLVTGIINEDDLLLREEVQRLQQKLNSFKRKKERIENVISDAQKDIRLLARKASNLGLLNISDDSDIFLKKELQRVSSNSGKLVQPDNSISIEINKLTKKRNSRIRHSRKLKIFIKEYDNYLRLVQNEKESIITANNFAIANEEIFDLPDAHFLLKVMANELENIKQNIGEGPKVKREINRKIKSIDKEVIDLDMRIKLLNEDLSASDNILKEQWIFVGELQAKLSLMKPPKEIVEYSDEIEALEQELDKYNQKLNGYPEDRIRVISALNEMIQEYLSMAKESLADYAEYLADFNYKDKTLQLRKPKSDYSVKVGSSSNHMFLHLCLFLGFQEYFITRVNKYIPSWLIFDQPSRPYFGDDDKDAIKDPKTDSARIKNMLEIFSNFAKRIVNIENKNFQIIMLEHIPKEMWLEDESLKDVFHLVEEFRNGNALIKIQE